MFTNRDGELQVLMADGGLTGLKRCVLQWYFSSRKPSWILILLHRCLGYLSKICLSWVYRQQYQVNICLMSEIEFMPFYLLCFWNLWRIWKPGLHHMVLTQQIILQIFIFTLSNANFRNISSFAQRYCFMAWSIVLSLSVARKEK